MTVRPVPGERDRYFVSSESRDIDHIVDLDFEGKIVCGCERSLIYNETCKHIKAVLDFVATHERRQPR